MDEELLRLLQADPNAGLETALRVHGGMVKAIKATNEVLRGIESFTYRYDAGYFLDTAAAVTLPLA